jgi:hypothetical protein
MDEDDELQWFEPPVAANYVRLCSSKQVIAVIAT